MKVLILASVIVILSGCAVSPGSHDIVAYEAFGQKKGIKKIVDDMFVLIDGDERIGRFFAETDNEYIKEQLTEQFCVSLNGPCEYKGAAMSDSHAGLNIKREHFNALVELLRSAMEDNGVPFSAQNVLLSKLAPMHREIVEG